MPYTVPDWKKFQHYKYRRPIWIKLHRTLLDDYRFNGLPAASQALLIKLWLVASENVGGHIKDSDEALAYRLRMSVEDFRAALVPICNVRLLVKTRQRVARKALARR